MSFRETFVQSDQDLHCPLAESSDTIESIEWKAKTRMRPCACTE